MGFDFSSYLPASPSTPASGGASGGFDFSSYLPKSPTAAAGITSSTPSSPTSLGTLPQGITQDDIQQMYYLQGNPVADDPSLRMNKDSEGNVLGSFKDLSPDAYKTAEDQWNEQQKLVAANLLSGPQTIGGADGSSAQTVQYLGSAAPAALAGHSDYQGTLGTAQGEGLRLDNIGPENDSSGSFDPNVKMLNPSATYNDPNWGDLTYDANKNKSEGGLMDTFWKVAPMIPMLAATLMTGGAGAALFGTDLASTAGGTAGIGFGTDLASGAGAGFGTLGANAGAAAGAGLGSDAAIFGGPFSAATDAGTFGGLTLPTSVTNALPNAVKGGINALSSNNGKFDFSSYLPALVGAGAGMAGLPSYAAPLINAGIGLANGGGFDFSKYIPAGLQTIAKGLG